MGIYFDTINDTSPFNLKDFFEDLAFQLFNFLVRDLRFI